METITGGDFFLSATVIRAWKNDDKEIQDKILESITVQYKETWKKTMIYDSEIVPRYCLEELYEDAFYTALFSFNENGRTGKIQFTEPTVTGYVKQTVHRTFIKLYKKEIREREAIQEFERQNKLKADEDLNLKKLIDTKVENTLQKLTPENASLMQWRYLQKLKYPVIAERLKILEESCKQKLFRAKKDFIRIWKNNNGNEE